MKNFKVNKSGTDLFSSIPTAPESKLFPVVPTRKVTKIIEPSNDLAKDLSIINQKLQSVSTCIDLQNEILQQRVSDLEIDIATCREVLAILTTRINSMNSILSKPNSELSNIKTKGNQMMALLTPTSVIDFLQSNPLFLKSLLSFNSDEEIQTLLNTVEADVRKAFLQCSIKQIERALQCFTMFFQLQSKIQSKEFISLINEHLSQLFSSDTIYIFEIDYKTGEFFCKFNEKNLTISLKDETSLITNAIHTQSTKFYTDPSSDHNFSPSLDSLFNPDNRPILLIPILNEGLCFILHTNQTTFTFSNEDVSIAKLYGLLLEPLFHCYHEFSEIVHEQKIREQTQIVGSEFNSKSRFPTLLPFLHKILSTFINSDDIRLFIVIENENSSALTSYRVVDGRCIEGSSPIEGIPQFVIDNKYHLVTDSLNIVDISSFNETVDGWASEKPFAAFPIFKDQNQNVLAVLCLTGKRKFNVSDIDFIFSLIPFLGLLLPSCIEKSKLISMEESQTALNELPKVISKFSFDSLQQSKAIYNILLKLQKGIKAEIVICYLRKSSNDKVSFERLMTVRNEEEINHDLLSTEFLEYIFSSEKPINESDATQLPYFSQPNDVTITSIFTSISKITDEQHLLILCLNSRSSTGHFDDNYSSYLETFLFLIKLALHVQDNNQSIINQKKNAQLMDTIFKQFDDSIKQENPLLYLLQTITKQINFDNFMLLQHRSLICGYKCLLASDTIRKMTVSENNPFISYIQQFDSISQLDMKFISTTTLISYFPQFKSMIYHPIDKDTFIIYTGNNLVFDIEILKLFSPFIVIALESFLLSTEESIITFNEMNTIHFATTSLHDSDVVSRLFSINSFDESTKIECILKMFSNLDLLTTMETTIDEFTHFLLTLRSKYHEVPFHNWDHVIDTCQFVYSSIYRGNLTRFLDKNYIIAVLLASLMHDIDHRGLNTAFHVKTRSPLVKIYGDQSTLEKHQLSQAINLLHEELITKNKKLNKDICFWTVFSLSILSTDMIKHFEYMEDFEILGTQFDSSKHEHRLLLCQLLIKCGNVANCTRPFDVTYQMAANLQKEYEKQAEIEQKMKVSPSSINEFDLNTSMKLAEIEISFDNAIVLPLLKLLESIIPELSDYSIQMEDNKRQWEEKLKST